MYVSEATQFINDLKKSRPHLEAAQREGRALLWDKKPLDLTERAEQEAAHVAQQAYPYATK